MARNLQQNYFIPFGCIMKTNQISKYSLLIVFVRRFIDFLQPMLEYSIKCLMIQTNGNKRQNNCCGENHSHFTNADTEDDFAEVTNRRPSVPWQSTRFFFFWILNFYYCLGVLFNSLVHKNILLFDRKKNSLRFELMVQVIRIEFLIHIERPKYRTCARHNRTNTESNDTIFNEQLPYPLTVAVRHQNETF